MDENRSQNASDYDLIDVNGDGLPDLVTKLLDGDDTDNPLDPNAILKGVDSTSTAVLVNLNSGAGFLPAQQWTGALPFPIQSRSSVNRDVGLHFTISLSTGRDWRRLPPPVKRRRLVSRLPQARNHGLAHGRDAWGSFRQPRSHRWPDLPA
jgi:hypothetical protein